MRKSGNWTRIALVIGAGVIGACQIGKVAIAIPILQADLGLSLVAVSWIAGAYAALGIVGGIFAGFVVSFFAPHRTIAAGLAVLAAGSLMGAAAPDAAFLIASRVIEGAAFLAIAVACPALLRSLVTSDNEQVAFSLWAAYIPAGALLMMVAGPAIMQDNWRALWIFNGALALTHAILIQIAFSKTDMAGRAMQRLDASSVIDTFRSPIILLLASCFCVYTLQYFAIATFLPIFMVERLDIPLASAGSFAAIVLAANMVGNISAGVFLRLGVPLLALFIVVFLAIALGGGGTFSALVSPALVPYVSAVGMGLSALLPAAVISSMPRYSSSPERLMLSMGLIQQASSVGQLAGPAVLALWIETLGWPNVPYFFIALAVLGLSLALCLPLALKRAGK